MRFERGFESRFSAEAMFEAHRDGLMGFGPRLTGVKAVELRARTDEGPIHYLEHAWMGDAEALPSPLRYIVPSALFRWKDETMWDSDRMEARWAVTVPHLGRMVRLEGRHRFRSRPEGSSVHVEAELTVAFVSRFGGKAANAFVTRLFGDILAGSVTAVEGWLAES